MTTNLMSIVRRHDTAGHIGYSLGCEPSNLGDPMGALAAIGTTDCAHITDFKSLMAPGFGTTSLTRLTIALAQEVCRLQAMHDKVLDIYFPKPEPMIVNDDV
jgi:hypothetical protein